jgi:hypothetical protein
MERAGLYRCPRIIYHRHGETLDASSSSSSGLLQTHTRALLLYYLACLPSDASPPLLLPLSPSASHTRVLAALRCHPHQPHEQLEATAPNTSVHSAPSGHGAVWFARVAEGWYGNGDGAAAGRRDQTQAGRQVGRQAGTAGRHGGQAGTADRHYRHRQAVY